MTQHADLWKLQEIDSALDARRATLEDAQSRLGANEELDAARAREQELRASVVHAQGAQKDIELEADDLKEKISAAEQKLYSGTIRNPKELSDLQADVDQLKRHLAAVEDRELEALGALEQAEGEWKAAKAEADALAAAWTEEQADLRARVEQAAADITVLEANRREQAEYIDPEVLRTYDHVRRAHQGRGVAKLDRNLCLGCRISLPVSIVNRARAGTTMVQCPNCERILVA